jgi:hypothetical protein
MSATRQMCTLAIGSREPSRTVRLIPREVIAPESFHLPDVVNDEQWSVFSRGFRRHDWNSHTKQFDCSTVHDVHVAICGQALGQGVERVVFRLAIVELRGGAYVPVDKLVAKECKYEEGMLLRAEFHKTFCKTQGLAARIARKFNTLVAECCGRNDFAVLATISFLPCSVYEVWDQTGHNSLYYLVEKRLDHTKYVKWNSNNGHVHGHRSLMDVLNREPPKKTRLPTRRVNTASSLRTFVPIKLEQIAEESDEEGSGDDQEEDHTEMVTRKRGVSHTSEVKTEHFPQAFSHYSYRYTKRAKLVCDLQGVLDTSVTPHVFELTDPVIHYQSTSNRTRVFGRTDQGKKGMHNFFKTHTCNPLCCLLGLSGYTDDE